MSVSVRVFASVSKVDEKKRGGDNKIKLEKSCRHASWWLCDGDDYDNDDGSQEVGWAVTVTVTLTLQIYIIRRAGWLDGWLGKRRC